MWCRTSILFDRNSISIHFSIRMKAQKTSNFNLSQNLILHQGYKIRFPSVWPDPKSSRKHSFQHSLQQHVWSDPPERPPPSSFYMDVDASSKPEMICRECIAGVSSAVSKIGNFQPVFCSDGTVSTNQVRARSPEFGTNLTSMYHSMRVFLGRPLRFSADKRPLDLPPRPARQGCQRPEIPDKNRVPELLRVLLWRQKLTRMTVPCQNRFTRQSRAPKPVSVVIRLSFGLRGRCFRLSDSLANRVL